MTLVIGVDPHKQTHTAVAVKGGSGELAGELCAAAHEAGYAQLLTWAPAMAHARKSARTYGKSDSIDALAIARAALAHPQLPTATQDDAARDLQLLVNHREALVRQRSEAQDRLRWLLHDIDPDVQIPAGALDRKVWLERVARRLARGVADYAPQLLELKGCGALIAGKIIGETAGVGRFQSDAQFARLAGVAPIDASSGQQRRHRLNRHGNRQLNSALHKIAVVPSRCDPRARAYLQRKQQAGKSRLEALRALKRHLARTVFGLLRQPAAGAPCVIKVRGGKVRPPVLA
jgi:transposase